MLITLIVLVAYNLLTNRQEYVQLVVPQLITFILMPHVLVTYSLYFLYLIILKYRCIPTIKTSQRPYTRSIKQVSIESFLSDLNDALSSPEMFNCNNLEKLCNLIGDLTNQHFSAKIQSRRQYKTTKCPWITPNILAQIKYKNKLYAKYLKNRDCSIYNEYKKYRNKLTHIKKKQRKIILKIYSAMLIIPQTPGIT